MYPKSYIITVVILATIFIFGLSFILWYKYRHEPLLCGLKNGMGICYLNSTMQALFSSKQFNELLTKYSSSNNEMIKNLIEIRAMMRKGKTLNLLPRYKKMFDKVGDEFDFSQEGGYPLHALEYIGIHMEKTIPNDFFLAQENYEKTKKIQSDESLKQRFLRFYPLLRGNVDEMLKNGLERTIDKKSFEFPKLLIVCLWNVHSYTDTTCDKIVCNPEVTIFGKKYRLVALVISVKGKRFGKKHAFAIGLRGNNWYVFNDEYIELIKNKKLVFNNKFCSIAFYDQA
ncbi:putative Peptidase C19, ubiquitin carboxyl-terminal hydrolase 2 protein [Trachipleistophora hominis]|uniref:Putative Peptidase C19, ubiquitin carboxyl-terminal hydrolase 2 protein n=1 Tax=Trachipleistophora hominis TaxID=72359 RepID=L7JZH8_TRAHO|nr:putative Peptidase C19, ubiquitin carboxyl-terminal hydrolase 2 protein [Trachipleistophora hominis]